MQFVATGAADAGIVALVARDGAGDQRRGTLVRDSGGRLSGDRAGRRHSAVGGRRRGGARVPCVSSLSDARPGDSETVRVRRSRILSLDWTALWLTVRLATATTFVLLVVGIPIAYWLVFSPRRWKFLVEAVVALPLVLPPTVLGFYVLIAIGPLSPVGRGYCAPGGPRPRLHVRRAAGRIGAVLAAVRRAAVQRGVRVGRSPAARGVVVARRLAAVDLSAGCAAAVDAWTLTGIVLSFAHTLGEFGVVLMVGGNCRA